MENLLIATIPITLIFGIIFWIQIFLATMHEYHKFEKDLKLRISVQNATIMTIVFIIVVQVAIYLLLTQIIK